MIRLSLTLLLIATAAPALARTATGIGTQKDCVYLPRVTSQRIDDTGITLKEGARWYRSELGPSCPLKSHRAFSSRTPTGNLCRGDIIDVFDSSTRTGYGSCGMESFTQVPRPGPEDP